MSKKVTWADVRADFKQRRPKLHKRVIYWRPHSFATILLHFDDGSKATYNYDTKRLTYLNED